MVNLVLVLQLTLMLLYIFMKKMELLEHLVLVLLFLNMAVLPAKRKVILYFNQQLMLMIMVI
ncbi:MAG: hypothetical protein COB96_06360 [Planctomycetota bacterium]|nr:MAG: hypothetical protein COB96_06360 [Planctomycetota bacterium]